MRPDLTDITLVTDRSGSMHEFRHAAQKGVNDLIHEHASQEGRALLTLVQFDHEYEVLHSGAAISEVSDYQLRARGGTALLDAIGRGITETGTRLSQMPEVERPALVAFVIMTDGQENSSSEFTRSQLREMIRHQEDLYGWKFSFVGAGQTVLDEAANLGLHALPNATFSLNKVGVAYASTSSKITRMRRQALNRELILNEYTDSEREAML